MPYLGCVRNGRQWWLGEQWRSWLLLNIHGTRPRLTRFGLELFAIELVERDDFAVAGAFDFIVRLKRRFVLLMDLRLSINRGLKLGCLDEPL